MSLTDVEISAFDASFRSPEASQSLLENCRLRRLTVCGVFERITHVDDDTARMLTLLLRLPTLNILAFDVDTLRATISNVCLLRPPIERFTIYALNDSLARDFHWHRALEVSLRVLGDTLKRVCIRTLSDPTTISALILPQLQAFEGPLSLFYDFEEDTLRGLTILIVTETLCEPLRFVEYVERSHGLPAMKSLHLNVVDLEPPLLTRLIRLVPDIEKFHIESAYSDVAQAVELTHICFLPHLEEFNLFGFALAQTSSVEEAFLDLLLTGLKHESCPHLIRARFAYNRVWLWTSRSRWIGVDERALTIEESLE
ncbi:hypothetical protein AAF712_012840 [Marasmius tenuissimus]|uniref:Uncharacterized protein n=1 Tax=Marasmius tenuissimus TaxID=585030 RepID=A0ABR2ZHF9_9AGAR